MGKRHSPEKSNDENARRAVIAFPAIGRQIPNREADLGPGAVTRLALSGTGHPTRRRRMAEAGGATLLNTCGERLVRIRAFVNQISISCTARRIVIKGT